MERQTWVTDQFRPAWSLRPEQRPRTRTRGAAALATLLLCLAPTPAVPPAAVQAGVASDSPRRNGASGMLEPHTGSLLVDYYETYLRDHNIDAFRQHVSARYMEGTLARL